VARGASPIRASARAAATFTSRPLRQRQRHPDTLLRRSSFAPLRLAQLGIHLPQSRRLFGVSTNGPSPLPGEKSPAPCSAVRTGHAGAGRRPRSEYLLALVYEHGHSLRRDFASAQIWMSKWQSKAMCLPAQLGMGRRTVVPEQTQLGLPWRDWRAHAARASPELPDHRQRSDASHVSVESDVSQSGRFTVPDGTSTISVIVPSGCERSKRLACASGRAPLPTTGHTATLAPASAARTASRKSEAFHHRGSPSIHRLERPGVLARRRFCPDNRISFLFADYDSQSPLPLPTTANSATLKSSRPSRRCYRL
jgi:hypothetical protein